MGFIGLSFAKFVAIATLLQPAHAAGDVALGEYLSSTCVTCHQKSGEVTGGVPAIIGWPADQFIAVLDAYRKNERDNEVMRSISNSLSSDDIAALAAYFEMIKPNK